MHCFFGQQLFVADDRYPKRMEFFPYQLRQNQREIIATIRNTLLSGKDFVFESGTGSGKTICSLAATLPYALEHGKKIIYTTRTNAQQRQVILELRAIKDKLNDPSIPLFGVGMQGRANMCLLARNDPELSRGSAEELSKICANEKKKASSGKRKGCKYFRSFLHNKELVEDLTEFCKQAFPTAEEFIEFCEEKTICPYELNKILVPEATIVVVPYIYVFEKSLRVLLLDWLNIAEEDAILVVDEAHNLPDYLRDLFSAQLSLWMVNSCQSEAEKYGDPSIANNKTTISAFCATLIDLLQDLRDTYVYNLKEHDLRLKSKEKQDAFLPASELETELMSRLNLNSKNLRDSINDFIAYGEKIQEYRQKEGSLPRSYLHKLGVFLEFWTSIEMDQYIKLIVDHAQGKNPRIEAYCLDPSLGARVIKEFHASIHMSGTLEPLEEYRDSLGLSRHTELVSYPSPFPRENRLLLYTNDVTTKYSDMMKDPGIVHRMSTYITTLCNHFPQNTMVFFPSFNVMSMFRKNGICKDIERCLYIEEQGMSQSELMTIVEDFKLSGDEKDGAAMFSVIGGRVSEGMDFPAEQLEIALIVGIPYPKPTARQRGLQRYYDMKFGKGWEYTVNAPTARKLLQSIGRLIRTEHDRGIAIILDKRAPRFKPYLKHIQATDNLLADVRRFMHHHPEEAN